MTFSKLSEYWSDISFELSILQKIFTSLFDRYVYFSNTYCIITHISDTFYNFSDQCAVQCNQIREETDKRQKLACVDLKANVSQKILNWHNLRHSHSAEICIHFYCLSWMRLARQRKMIQSAALWLCLRQCLLKISWDT